MELRFTAGGLLLDVDERLVRYGNHVFLQFYLSGRYVLLRVEDYGVVSWYELLSADVQD